MGVRTAGVAVLLLSLLAVFSVHAADGAQTGTSGPPRCRLSVSFDLKNSLVRGTATITGNGSGPVAISPAGLRVLSAAVNGSPRAANAGTFRVESGETLEIRYEGTFAGTSGAAGAPSAPVQPRLVSEQGISLTGAWYPQIEGLAYYELTAVVPPGFQAISEADEITSRETASGREYSFSFPHPLEGLDLAAAPYREFKESLGNIDIYAYFFPSDADLAPTYLAHAKKFLQLYSSLILPYPYKRFSIVENALPTGLSMPTFTLIGQEVLRLPFIPSTSLGHEICHQWFGNWVYADFSKGNWLEAVTSYLSDHLYRKQEGKGWEYRKNIMIDYQSSVHPDNEFPLRKFRERTDAATMAIGYGKGAMLFHMLEDRLGDPVFYGSLRSLIKNNAFREASWADVERSFEHESGSDLSWFFSQWLDRTGVPDLGVRHPGSREYDGVPSASLDLVQQQKEPYRISVPAFVNAGKTERKEVLSTQTGTKYFRIPVDEPPSTLVLDRDYDVMRALSPEEFPPVIARLLGSRRKLLVYPKQDQEKYSALIAVMKARGFDVREEGALKDQDIRTSSLLVTGADSPVWKRLFGEPPAHQTGFALTVRDNPFDRSQVVALVQADSREEVDLAAPKITHYGTYSFLRFEKGENREKQTAASDRGMVSDLSLVTSGVMPARAPGMDEIVDAAAAGGDAIVLIGERHTNYEDHKEELAVIRGLFEKGIKIAVGMEMFQKPFQGAIDAYLAGRIDEREFLKQTEYFKRWVFDYNLYREIVEYCKAKKIPLLGLNQRTEIMDKVAHGGLDALTPEEKKQIPADMNMSDEAYRNRLQAVYAEHPAGTTFDNFYQSQILWDETMAHTGAAYLKEHPDHRLVVLAGVEHIMYGSGIPSRIKRLTGREYITLVNGTLDRGVGTYALFPEPLESPFTPKLGIVAKESGGRLIIQDVAPGSPAQKAGLEPGDVILSVAGWKTKSVPDVRIALFDKEPGETVDVAVQRTRFFALTRKVEIKVVL